MTWQTTPIQILLFLGAFAALLLGGYAFARYRRSRQRAYIPGFIVLCAAVGLWSFAYGMQLAFPTLEGKLFAYTVLHIGGVTVPPAWAIFAVSYVYGTDWITVPRVGVLFLIPVALVSSLVIDPFNLAIIDARLIESRGHLFLETDNGPLYNLHLAYSYLLVLLGSGVIGLFALRLPRRLRRQSSILLLGALTPFVINILHVSGMPPLGDIGINLTPVSLTLSVLLFGFAIFHYDLLDLTPVARSTVLDTMAEGVIVIDGAGRIVDFNVAAREFLDVGNLIGARIGDILSDVPEYNDDTNGITELGDGTVVHVTRRPISSRYNAEGSVLLLQDVTELHEHQQTLEQQNERLEAFAGTISHDLRNPLGAVSGYAELAQETGDPEYFEKLDRTVNRMDDFLADLLVLAKKGRTVETLEPVDVELVVAQVRSTLETTVAIEVDISQVIMADQSRLRQVISNLLHNAILHAGEGATIRIGALEDGFFIEDDGPGIPADQRERVFEYGVSTRENGSGFGLAIVHDIVTAHGWDIAITESSAGGARFEIRGVEQVEDAAPGAG